MKAQTSTEFIVILAIVLVIIIAGISITSDLSPISYNLKKLEYRRYWKISDIGINAFVFNGSHGKMSFLNNMEDTIEMTSVVLDEEIVFSGHRRLSKGDSVILNFSKTVKSSYDLNISVNYYSVEDGKLYSFIGEAPLIGDVVEGNLW